MSRWCDDRIGLVKDPESPAGRVVAEEHLYRDRHGAGRSTRTGLFARPTLVGLSLIVAAVGAMLASTLGGPLAGLATLAAVVVGCLLLRAGAVLIAPRSAFGWGYAALIISVSIAPSLGTVGTSLRFSLAILAFLLAAHCLLGDRERFPRRVVLLLWVILVILTASALAAPSLWFGAARWVNWVMFAPLLVLYFCRPDVRGVVFGILTAAGVQLVGVFLQINGMLGGSWGGLLLEGTSYTAVTASWLRRYSGFIQNPNDLAMILALGCVIATALFIVSRGFLPRLLCSILLIGFTWGAVQSGSRGGLLAAVLGCLIVVVFLGMRSAIAGGALAILAIIGLSFVQSAELNRLLTSFGDLWAGTDASAVNRGIVWARRSEGFGPLDYLTGAGFGGYSPELFAAQNSLDIDRTAASLATVDNSWLKILLESGSIAVVAFAILFAMIFQRALFNVTTRTVASIVASAGLAAIIWRSFSIDLFDVSPWNAIIPLLVAVALRSSHISPMGPRSLTIRGKPSSQIRGLGNDVPGQGVVTKWRPY